MYDLSAVLARLRREDSPLSAAVRELADRLCPLMEKAEREGDEVLRLWREEQAFLWGGGEQEEVLRRARSLHTVYSLLIKLIAYRMAADARGAEDASLEEILSGRAFRALGIMNFCGEDWYCRVLQYRDGETEKSLQRLCAALQREDTVRSAEDFVSSFRPDSLKRIYETVIGEELRTALGEYYTPDWLATCIVQNALEADGRSAAQLRFVDPTCGAGTFLTGVMRRLRAETEDGTVPEGAVAGFDINPLAVLTARTNYLAAMIDYLPDRLLIPVYQQDILNLPMGKDGMLSISLSGRFSCALPRSLCERIAEEKNFDPDELLTRIGTAAGCEEISQTLRCCDGFTRRLIARLLLEQIFAFFEEKADIVVGNPPWVNWEKLSPEYREKSRGLWAEYGLYNGRGKNVRFLKEDISVLITCVAMDRFLRDGGLLSFALRQALFKSEKNGAMFRRFSLREGGTLFRVLRLDDMGKIKPFAGVNIRAALVLIRKNEPMTFPVPYLCWSRKKGFLRATRTPEVSAETIRSFVEQERTLAFPSSRNDPASLWVNFPEELASVTDKVLGSNGYKARTGVFTGGANAVYWLDVLDKGDRGGIRVRNVVGRAKRRTETVETEIEDTYVYPLVQGHDITPWKVKRGGYLLCPHTAESKMWPVEEEILRRETPLTYEYLCRFRAELDERKGFAGWENEIRAQRFYAVLRIGDYTFAKYKVAWRYIAQSFITAVIEDREDPVLGEKLCIPNEKVMYVGTDNREEAYYLCGVLSSLPVSYCVRCYMNPTSISAHVLGKLRIPPYDGTNPCHRTISALCEAGHRETDPEKTAQLRTELDKAAAELYGIDGETMQTMRRYAE